MVALLNRLVRLSYWERVQSVLPEQIRPLLPPKPEVRIGGQAGFEHASRLDMRLLCFSCGPASCCCCCRAAAACGAGSCACSTSKDTRLFASLPPSQPQVAGLPDPNDAAAAEADPEGHWAALILQRVRGKASAEELDAWRLEQVR